MDTRTLRFIRRGAVVALDNVPPDRTLLELLREDLGCTGTKEGCGEGDCGACTVVTAQSAPGSDAIEYRAINSCIRLAHSIDGMALWTVEDIAPSAGRLHPAQEAMVACHGSQCGFCTPGFVMSLFGIYQNEVCKGRAITRGSAQQALTGNLCRCTGYRPILDAAQQMASLPRVAIDEEALRAQLAAIRPAAAGSSTYMAPLTLAELLQLRAAHPQAQVVAGCTDAGLWVTKMHRRFAQVLDLTRVAELRAVQRHGDHLRIGASVPLQDAFAALAEQRPQLRAFADRFAGLPIRNSGTLGGNVANGSPIGDSMPLLIALNAHLVLASARGERRLAVEEFYTGYRQNVLATDEIVAWIDVPLPAATEFLRAYKVSKRFDDDISAVCLVMAMEREGDTVLRMSIGAGGVAATPVRARAAEGAARGLRWDGETAVAVADALKREFQPISDMRASAAYRSQVLGNLVRRFLLESEGAQQVNLETFVLEEAA
jgi:xanthine dehydrogenase small subunit